MDMNQEFTDFIKNSELAQAFRDKQRADLAAKRQEALDACPPLEKELAALSTKITGIKSAHVNAMTALDEQKKALERETCGQLCPLLSRAGEIERALSGHNAFLRSNLEKEISETASFFKEKLQETLATNPSSTSIVGDRRLSGRAEIIIHTNRPAIMNRADYCRAALRELESMALSAAKCDLARIEALIAGLPDIRETTEIIGWQQTADSIWKS